MIKHLEIKSYEYGDIKVSVKIDYDNNLVSLIDKGNNLPNTTWGDKKWLFSSRNSEYKNGWLNIIEAMKYAIEESFLELESYNKMKIKEKNDNVEAILTKATELVKSEKKICKYSNCQNTCKSKGLDGEGKTKYGNLCQKHKGMEK